MQTARRWEEKEGKLHSDKAASANSSQLGARTVNVLYIREMELLDPT